jgi:hypothetical protein
MTRRLFVLSHDLARANAKRAIDEAEAGWRVTLSEPLKSREQEEKYHAQLGDLANQWTLHGRKWDAESMKRLCVDQFRRDTAKDPDLAPLWEGMGTVEMAPSIDGSGIVALGWQTRRFPKRLASAFVEWLYALGAEVGIVWSEPKQRMAA